MKATQNYGPAPLVSLIIVTHDGDVHLLPRALESVKAQTFPHSEIDLIIAYDGPPATEVADQIAALLEGSDLSGRLIWSETKTGYYTVARNYATTHAQGLYIINMDADNEFLPEHLAVLVEAMRIPDPEWGWPHFAYTRREYVRDEGAQKDLPEGPSSLIDWAEMPNRAALLKSPHNNFIDTGDFMVSRSALYELAERTGCMWNSECRRFGDHELMTRFIAAHFRGKAVDKVTHRYHWTGKNLQVTRHLSQLDILPVEVYDRMKAEGKIVDA